MKTFKNIIPLSIIAILALVFTYCSTSNAQTEKVSFKVYGNCDMCKERIDAALKIKGVSSASWDVETKLMTVAYDPKVIDAASLQKKVAAVGHDTQDQVADAGVYKELPGCCQYTRKK